MHLTINKRKQGAELELFAIKVLEDAGCNILTTNFHCKLGEVDIILKDREHLVFVEVRYRKADHYGGAVASVDYKKQSKLIKTARYFLQTNRIYERFPCRFDVFAIKGSMPMLNYQWIKDAFQVET